MSGKSWSPELPWVVHGIIVPNQIVAQFFLTESRVSHTFAQDANVWGTRARAEP